MSMRINGKPLQVLQLRIIDFLDNHLVLSRLCILLLLSIGSVYWWLGVGVTGLSWRHCLIAGMLTVPALFMMYCLTNRFNILLASPSHTMLGDDDLATLKDLAAARGYLDEFEAFVARHDTATPLTVNAACRMVVKLDEKRRKTRRQK